MNLALLLVLMAKGMTTDVYPRDNCIAPDIKSCNFKHHLLGCSERAQEKL